MNYILGDCIRRAYILGDCILGILNILGKSDPGEIIPWVIVSGGLIALGLYQGCLYLGDYLLGILKSWGDHIRARLYPGDIKYPGRSYPGESISWEDYTW